MGLGTELLPVGTGRQKRELEREGRGNGLALPALLTNSTGMGDAPKAYAEWLLAGISNRGTRTAYASALRHFDTWLQERSPGFAIEQLEALHIAAYLEDLGHQGKSVATRKLRLAAISELCKCLVVHRILATNPAAAVKGPRERRRKGATPVLSGEQARVLLDACGSGSLRALRDRALSATMLYTFSRISATTRLRVRDYQSRGRRAVLMLREKGDQVIEAPCHPELAEAIDAWLQASGLADQPGHILFPPIGAGGALRNVPLHAQTTLVQLQRRAAKAGIGGRITNHSLRATGITAYLEHGGSLEIAQHLAGHASPVTTQLYDGRRDEVAASEVDRIRFE